MNTLGRVFTFALSTAAVGIASADIFNPVFGMMSAGGSVGVRYTDVTGTYDVAADGHEEQAQQVAGIVYGAGEAHITGQPDSAGDGWANGRVEAALTSNTYVLSQQAFAMNQFYTVPDTEHKYWWTYANGTTSNIFDFTVSTPTLIRIQGSGVLDAQTTFFGELFDVANRESVWRGYDLENGPFDETFLLAPGEYDFYTMLWASAYINSDSFVSAGQMDFTLTAQAVPEPLLCSLFMILAPIGFKRRKA